eukprot:gene10461-8418_t
MLQSTSTRGFCQTPKPARMGLLAAPRLPMRCNAVKQAPAPMQNLSAAILASMVISSGFAQNAFALDAMQPPTTTTEQVGEINFSQSAPLAATQSAPDVQADAYKFPEGSNWRYSEFLTAVEDGKIERVRFAKDGSALQLTAVDGRRASVTIPNDSTLVDVLAANSVDISVSEGEQQGNPASLLGNILFPLLAFGGLFLLFGRGQQGGGGGQPGQGGGFGGMGGGGPMEFGKNKSKFQEVPETGVTFDDVAEISKEEIADALERIIAGPEKKGAVVSEKKRRLVAYHEAGHAVVGALMPEYDPVTKITIVPRGGAGGITFFAPSEERLESGLYSRSYLENQMAVAMGGRIAEELIFGEDEITTGASGDFQQVSRTARLMVTQLGFCKELGQVCWSQGGGNTFLGGSAGQPSDFSSATADTIDAEVKKLVETAYRRAKDLVSSNIDILHRTAAVLLEKENIDGEEFLAIVMERQAQHYLKDDSPEQTIPYQAAALPSA